jgi:hypothetical protein
MINVEKIMVWLPAAISGAAAVAFAAMHVLMPKAEGLKKAVFTAVCFVSSIFAFFLYMYSRNFSAAIAGIYPVRSALVFALLLTVTAPFCLDGTQDRLFYFPASAMLFIALLGACFCDPMTEMLLFCLSGALFFVFSGRDTAGREGPDTAAIASMFFFFLAAFISAGLFFSSGPGRAGTMAYTGFLAALIVSSPPAFYTLRRGDPPLFASKFAASRFFLRAITAGAQIIIMAAMMSGGQWSRIYMTLFAGTMLAMAMFKSITEESYISYALRDSANLGFLALLYFSCTCSPAGNMAAMAACGALLSAAASYEMIRANPEELTVTALKLAPSRVKNGFAGYIAQIILLAVEVTVIAAIKKGIVDSPAVQAAAIISVVFYIPAVLNRIFSITSMSMRFIKVDAMKKLSFNDSAIKLVLYGAVSAALFCRW